MASWIAFSAAAKLDSDYYPFGYMGDSSDLGYALMRTPATATEMRPETRYQERWRFVETHVVSEESALDPGYEAWLGGLSADRAYEDRDDDALGPHIFSSPDVPSFSPSPSKSAACSTAFASWASNRTATFLKR